MKMQGRRDVLQCTSTMCGSGSLQFLDCIDLQLNFICGFALVGAVAWISDTSTFFNVLQE